MWRISYYFGEYKWFILGGIGLLSAVVIGYHFLLGGNKTIDASTNPAAIAYVKTTNAKTTGNGEVACAGMSEKIQQDTMNEGQGTKGKPVNKQAAERQAAAIKALKGKSCAEVVKTTAAAKNTPTTITLPNGKKQIIKSEAKQSLITTSNIEVASEGDTTTILNIKPLPTSTYYTSVTMTNENDAWVISDIKAGTTK